MTVRTLLLFLVGSRRAIVDVASSRWLLLVGFLLVVSAGFARYYDSAYLATEWTVLLRGVGVSVFNSFVLYLLAVVFVFRPQPDIGSRYLSFLGLFWMTAPMAWLYAIPYERFLTPIDAVHANAWTLAFVSVWRVLLITRILSILLGVSAAALLFPVLFFSDVAVYIASLTAPQPIFDLMGGLHLTEIEREISRAAFVTQVYSMLAIPGLFIATLVAAGFAKRTAPLPITPSPAIPKPLLGFALISIGVWIPILIAVQPEQRLRFRTEEALRAGRVDEAIAEMSSRIRADYPPVWDPPPRLLYEETLPTMTSVREGLLKQRAADWVRELFLEKSRTKLARSFGFSFNSQPIENLVEQLKAQKVPDLSVLRFHLEFDPDVSASDRLAMQKALDSDFKAK
ncbi:MAG: hypothetical protein JNM86_14955 [Phycisphaerae bacterium]|nr:hypothetical protein [Phycisphaerae bacterium]